MAAGTPDDLVVRPYAAGDRGAVLQLLRDVWSRKRHVETEFEERWWWQFDQPPLHVVASPEQGLVGLCAHIPFSLRTRGLDVPSAWFVDFYVRERYQGRGLGRRLTQAVQQCFPITASLSQTAMAWRVFQRMGWHEREAVALYMNPFPARWLSRGLSPSLSVSAHAISPGFAAAADLDGLWLRVRDRYTTIARRDSVHLLARYRDRGDRRYTLLSAYRGGECTGYMIVRAVPPLSAGRPPDGLIVDYLVSPDDSDTFAGLLSRSAAMLAEAGAGRTYCIATSPGCRRVLASRGFLSPATPLLGRLLRSNVKWLTWSEAPEAAAIDPAGWFLTMGDCDIDYAWHRD